MGKNSLTVHQHDPGTTDGRAAVTYELSARAEVQLKLYDHLGTLILLHHEGERPEGIHTIDIDTCDLPDGRYYYLLETGDASAIRSLTVSKVDSEQAEPGAPALDEVG